MDETYIVGNIDYYEKKCSGIDSFLQSYIYEKSECETLAIEEKRFRELRTQMYERYSGKYGTVQRGESRRYTEEELRQIRMELADTSLATIIKRFLGFGKSTKDIYVDLMSKLNGLIYYLHEQFDSHQERYQEIAGRILKEIDEYNKEYECIKATAGYLPSSDWDDFQPSTLSNHQLLLGNVKYPLQNEIATVIFNSGHCVVNGDLFYPYLKELETPFRLVYNYNKTSAKTAIQTVQSLIFQMLRLSPEYYSEFYLMDGATSGKDFGEIRNLQKVKKQDITYMNRRITGGHFQLAKLYLDKNSITQGLDELNRWMTAVAGEMGQYSSLTEYNRNNGKDAWIPYQVVVIHNFPAGFEDRDIKILDRIIINGKTLGIFVILLNSIDRWDEINRRLRSGTNTTIKSLFSKDALESVTWFDLTDENAKIYIHNVWNDCTVQIMRDEHAGYINNVVSTLNQEKKQDNLFQNLFDIENSFGEYDSTNGLHIPFAVTRRGEIMEYRLGTAMNAHGLICGGTGSGKSTLLHMLISSIVMNYSPNDVEIWLADYKITEFYSYKTNTPPHIGFIGLSKTPDFSYAFIDKITDEMNSRQNIIAEADYAYKKNGGRSNITSFNDYRKIYGTFAMKRLIVIIDEFHVMSQHAQAEPDYKIKLENILAEARAMGITMLFSDQAIVDGLRGLSDKGKKQIKARIALSNYLDELKETLGEVDREKLLSFIHMGVGEVAIQTVHENEDKEEVTIIERALAIYINGANRYKVNEKARSFYHAENYIADSFDDRVIEPMVISDIDQWEKGVPTQHRDGSRDMQIYLGKPVDLQFALSFSLLRRPGNNIMSVSGSEEQQMRILKSVVNSFVRQKDYEILILSDTYASLFREYEPEIRKFSESDSKIQVYDQLNDICYQVNRVLNIVNNRDNTNKVLVIWLGLDAIADIMADESPIKPNSLCCLNVDETGNKTRNPNVNLLSEEKQEELAMAFDDLFGPFDEELFNETENVSENISVPSDEYIYNAREDISRIVHIGPSRNVFNMVIYDSAISLRDFREVKASDFRHKIAFPMDDSEAGDYLDRSNLIRNLPDYMAYYYNGRVGRRFIPYKM